MLAYVLAVEAVICLSAAVLPFLTSWHRADFLRFTVLVLLGLIFEEISARIARLRARLAAHTHVDMTSVWTFSAAMVLPPALILPLCVIIIVDVWLRHGRQSGMRPYRQVFAASVVVSACYISRAVMLALGAHSGNLPESVTAVLTIGFGLVVYLLVNAAVLHTAIYLAVRPESLRSLLNSWQDISLEISTLCLGGLTALALVYQPLLALLVVPPMFVLQRSVLTKQLEVAATTDAKTGLLNAATWHHVATREIARASREKHSAAVLIIDMDNFKNINDNFGHLVGDDVLLAVAGCLAEEMRGYDSIGRFGGEEFVAVLSDVDELTALTISERIRKRIALLEVPARNEDQPALTELSASIGVACFPEHGSEVEVLLHAADAALYVAKRAGRNRVEISGARLDG
ncbi:MAG: GGDEF domain-containing protein [Actinomycetota bacterium]|nr:GGDEF domain-containing protein [Actinomycetota bacterium]